MAGSKTPGPTLERARSGSLRQQLLGAGARPGPSGAGSPRGASDPGSLTYKHPGSARVRLALFWLSNYFGQNDVEQVKRADTLLIEHGLALDPWPAAARTELTTLKFADRLVEREDYEDLRTRIDTLMTAAGKGAWLPILFCQFRFTSNGLTTSDTATKCWPTPFCLVGPTAGGDNVTLLHEVGHAAGLGHDTTSTNILTRNFMHEANTRTTLYRWQVEKLAQAFFAR